MMLRKRNGCSRRLGLAGAFALAAGLALAGPAARAVCAGSRVPDGERVRGEVAYYNGDLAQAETEYRRYLEGHGQDRAAALDLAAVLMEDGRPAEAARLLVARGEHGALLGEAYLAAGDFARAETELASSLRRSGSQWRTRMLLGMAAGFQGRHADAVEFYWQALNEDSRQPTVHLLLARALAALGQDSPGAKAYFRARAREEYERALKTDPSLWQVHGDLAQLAEDEGQYRLALREWDRVREVIGRAAWVEDASARVTARAASAAPTPRPTPAATPVPAPPPAAAENAQQPRRVPGARALLRDIRVAPLSPADDPTIRVGLADRLGSLAFGSSGGWIARDLRGRRIWEGVPGRGYRLTSDRRSRWTLRTWDGRELKRVTRTLVIEPLDPTRVLGVVNLYQSTGYYWGGGWRATRYYRGRLIASLQGRQLQLVNAVPLEEYLASVVPSEMPASWPAEALKAQAVAARSDALARRGTHGRQGYDVCNNPHCCEYAGVAGEDPRTLAAITATAGETLVRQGVLVPAFYSHACGGVTQDFADAWGQGKQAFDESECVLDAPADSAAASALPLAPRRVRDFLFDPPDVYCADPRYSGKASFRWTKVLSRDEANALLGDRYAVGNLREIRVSERSRSAYVRELSLEGESGHAKVRGDRIRSLLGGLRSNFFYIQPVTDAASGLPLAWVVSGGGWGHGVGFCQAGAASMGSRGIAYAEILKHYFPGTTLASDRGRNPEAAPARTAQDAQPASGH